MSTRLIKELEGRRITLAMRDNDGRLHLTLDTVTNVIIDDGVGGPVSVVVNAHDGDWIPLEDCE